VHYTVEYHPKSELIIKRYEGVFNPESFLKTLKHFNQSPSLESYYYALSDVRHLSHPATRTLESESIAHLMESFIPELKPLMSPLSHFKRWAFLTDDAAESVAVGYLKPLYKALDIRLKVFECEKEALAFLSSPEEITPNT